MPVVACKCSNGHQWDDLIGNTVLEAIQDPQCPTCHLAGQIIPCGNAIMPKGYEYPDPTRPMSPEQALEYEGVMEHRRFMEMNTEARDDGRFKVKETGPNWARPHGNAERPRKYY